MPPPWRSRVIFLALAAALAGSARPALASPEDILGFGARSMALGATGAADARGYEAVYGNPALLSLGRERELTLGLLGAHFDLRAGERLPYEGLHGTLIGASLPIPFGGPLEDRVALGLGFFTPGDLIVRGRILYPETPQFLIADRVQSVAVQVGLGVHVVAGLRVGVGFAALAALSGDVQVGTDASGRIGTVVENTLVASYGPIVGASYDLGRAYRVGATFRGTLEGRFNVVINAKDLGQIVIPPLNISGIAQYDPWQVAAEVARVKGPWKVSLGATFKRWSGYPGPIEATVRCPSPGEVPAAPSECGALVPSAVGFQDTITPRVGVERSFELAPGATAHVRGGLFFESTPAPEQTRRENLFDNSRTALSAGYGLELGGPLPPLDLDLATQLQILHPRTHDKEAGVPADNPGAPSVRTSGFIVAGALTLGARF